MKKALIVTAAGITLCSGLSSISIAEEALTSQSGASIEATLSDLQRRVEQLESRVGGKTLKSGFQAQNRTFRHVRPPRGASNAD